MQRNDRALLTSALREFQAGRIEAAWRHCQLLLAGGQHEPAVLHLTGLIALQKGENELALDVLQRALATNDRAPDLQAAIGEALQRVGQLDEAIAHYQRAIAIDPTYVDALYNCGNLLLKLRRYHDAIALYDRAVAHAPGFAEALHNRGNAFLELGLLGRALADYDRALALRPQFAAALANRGGALVQLKRCEEALAACDFALAIEPDNVTALANRASALFELRRFEQAAAACERLLVLDPDYEYARGKALYFKLLHCDWDGYDKAVAAIVAGIEAGKRVALPYMLLNILDSPRLQLRAARIYNADKIRSSASAALGTRAHRRRKIRLAYISADFRPHPMAYLMAGVFENHDRSRFETFAVSLGPSSNDDFTLRLAKSFDRFLDLRNESDETAAHLLGEHEVDITVDLMGYTSNSRPGLMALRAAPIQVNFLGYAGTLGADYIDYILADRFVIPEVAQKFYTEQVVYLPDTYYPCGALQVADLPTLDRADLGLSETGFVFCCFNQSTRISPIIFEVWMRLLANVDDSVLWLVEDSPASSRNLRLEAGRRGIPAHRLVFSPRVAIKEYLGRMRLADLFLDTVPYNAHTTAKDALSVGLPVVTCAGASFPARVAGSLLSAAGLPELITERLQEYEALALRLANDRKFLAQVRAKLVRNRESHPLFDTLRFCRHLETGYETMWQCRQRGELPSSFTVEKSHN